MYGRFSLKIVMVAISFASVEQNRLIFTSFSWLLDDCRRRMAIYEGKCLLLNVTLLHPAATHLFGILWPTTTSDLLPLRPLAPLTCMSTRFPFYFRAPSRSNSPVTRTWTKMAAIKVQFFELWRDIKRHQIFHQCTRKNMRNYLVKKWGLGALKGFKFFRPYLLGCLRDDINLFRLFREVKSGRFANCKILFSDNCGVVWGCLFQIPPRDFKLCQVFQISDEEERTKGRLFKLLDLPHRSMKGIVILPRFNLWTLTRHSLCKKNESIDHDW